MSMPPQGGWPPQGPPPNQGPPSYGPPPGWQQGPWQPVPPPPPKSNTIKWLLGATVLLLVICATIGATLLFTRDGGGSQPPTSGVPSDIASANDTGPVAIITDEPTCKALKAISTSLGAVQGNGWSDQHRTLGPAADWSGDQRAQVEAVSTAMSNAADQMVALAKQSPHRVVRELYEQFIAYSRAYADSVQNYTPMDDQLAIVSVNIDSALFGICKAIEYGSASRSLAIRPASAPTKVTEIGDPADPRRFLASSNATCTDWLKYESDFIADTSDWEKLDPNVPVAQWTPERKTIQDAAFNTFTALANNMETAGRRSENAVIEDFAVLGALYSRAYVAAGNNYLSADSWLSYPALRLLNSVSGACKAVAN